MEALKLLSVVKELLKMTNNFDVFDYGRNIWDFDNSKPPFGWWIVAGVIVLLIVGMVTM